jgi:hypothetical protein
LQKGKNLDEFNIPAHLKAEREKVMQEQGQSNATEQEVAPDSPGRPVPEQAPVESTYRPKTIGVFEGFDDDE